MVDAGLPSVDSLCKPEQYERKVNQEEVLDETAPPRRCWLPSTFTLGVAGISGSFFRQRMGFEGLHLQPGVRKWRVNFLSEGGVNLLRCLSERSGAAAQCGVVRVVVLCLRRLHLCLVHERGARWHASGVQ